MFDPEKFGQAMGESIRKAVEPLRAEIAALKKQISEVPAPLNGNDGAPGKDGSNGADGKDCDIEVVKALVAEAVKDIRVIHGTDGKPGKDGERGEKGESGIGAAGAMIDRDGNLLITMTNGEVKTLGQVVGKDGVNGKDGTNGADGLSFESFEMEYLPDSHEVCIKASVQGRTKEIRYSAGGLHAKGYWREGTKAKSGEAWVNDGSLWIAMKDNESKPGLNDAGWIIAARKGRDGERGATGKSADPVPHIKLQTAA